MEKSKVKIDEKMSRDVLAECLRSMARDLDNGLVGLCNGDQTIVLSVPTVIPVEIEAKQKANKEKIAIEITWREPGTPQEADEAPDGALAGEDPVDRECSGAMEMGLPAAGVAVAGGGDGCEPFVEMTAVVGNTDAVGDLEIAAIHEESGEGADVPAVVQEATAQDSPEPQRGAELAPLPEEVGGEVGAAEIAEPTPETKDPVAGETLDSVEAGLPTAEVTEESTAGVDGANTDESAKPKTRPGRRRR